MISLNNICLSFADHIIFNNISFLIRQKDRIGLVGNNGAGKTTMLKIITGEQSADSGNIEKPSGITIGYLPQQMKHSDSRTLFNEVKTAFNNIIEIEKNINRFNTEIEERNDYHSEKYLKILSKIADLNTRLDNLGAGKMEEKIEKTLSGLGFMATDYIRQTSEFSGGWRMRVELAKILLKHPDLILLDEPTNHLDIESIQWLEDFLANYNGAVMIISHDRTFLDNVTNRTIEISLGNIYDYKVPYSKYLLLRQERRAQQLAAYKNQQKEIKDTKEFIERFRYKASKAVQVQSRVKQLDKMDIIQIDEEDTSAIRIRFPSAPRSGNIVIDAVGISKSYGENIVLENIDLILRRNEKIAFVGKNGEGKTTLSRIIVGEIDFKGALKIGHNVKIGYFAQNQDELMDENLTVFETIDRVAIGDIRTRLRSLLGAFLFKNDDIDKKVKVLSGGERSRLALIKLLLEPFNLLVLDEPTNHLDMRSKDILKQALLNYNGTLIIVSHDRQFLDSLTDKVYEFHNHKIISYSGSIFDFLEKKKIDSLRELEINCKIKESKPSQKTLAGKESYIEKKELNKSLRKITKSINSCESSIEKLENELDELSKQLESPSVKEFNNSEEQSIFLKYGKFKKELDEKMTQWENLHSALKDLRKKIESPNPG
ncbi:MAG: ABC-F family ATP-binding cassette domain-containing protein [Actinomycetota bacterium]|nr:ABC-F family ATP-binding cassette domain-containing protein [Actinomycetota bacterium]